MNGTQMELATLAATLLAATSASAADISANIVDAAGKPLREAVVYLVPAQPVPLAKPKHVVIDQIDKEFVPRVTVVQAGTAVDFPNHDNIRHQVYSFSPAKTFELKLYSGRPSAPVVFDKTGLAVLGCNIHDHMIAWVLSVDTPWFTQTDAQGRARIADLPPGKYEMLAWHPGLPKPISQGPVALTGSIERSITLATGAMVGATTDEEHHEHHATGS
jgi:plastocyanin